MSGANIARLAQEALPFFACGAVVHGFGRGSKDLGIPTANFHDDVVENLPVQLTCGVYCGFASVNEGNVYPMCLSIGWNPYYKNTKRTMETHIIHKFDSDFYEQQLKVVILRYIRPMTDFTSMDDLILAIDNDIKLSLEVLAEEPYAEYAKHQFFEAGSLDVSK